MVTYPCKEEHLASVLISNLKKSGSAFSLFCMSIPSLTATPSLPPVSETPDGQVNYPSNFQVEKGANLFLTGEYLYWVGQEDALYYAQGGKGEGSGQLPPSSSKNFMGPLKKVEPEWESAFRVGIGIDFPKEGYDLGLEWTSYSSQASNTSHSPSGRLIPLWTHPDSPATSSATLAKGRWDLSLNLVDLFWGRSSWFGEHFSVYPFFGLRGACVEQTFETHCEYATLFPVIGKLHATSDFLGGGIRAGAQLLYAFPHGFFLYGLFSGSLLYGQLRNNLSVKENQFTIARSKDHPWNGIPALQMGLGLGWETHLWKDHLHVEFHAGWEQNAFFNLNQMGHPMNPLAQGNYFQEKGNLSLQGIVAGGKLHF